MQNIQDILKDLYAIDPGLKKHEAKLVEIISGLLASKPNITIDQHFAEQLRSHLQVRANELQDSKMSQYHSGAVRKLSWFTYAFASLGILALAGSGFLYYQARPGIRTAQEVVSLLSKDTEVKSVAPGSFGSLATLTLGGGQGGDNMEADARTQTDIPPGAGGTPMPNPMMPAPVPDGSKMIAPDYAPFQYKFVYKGSNLTAPEAQMDVFKRNKGFNTTGTSQLIDKISFGLVNINKFSNRQLDNLSILENKEYGYVINAGFRDGSISIHENWEKWPTIDKTCRDQACFEANQLKPGDVPGDDVIIKIANDFLKDYGISRAGYGQPQVQDYWKVDMERAAVQGYPIYVPDSIGVVYPLQIAGGDVFDEGGSPTGLFVNVNVRVNKVNSVYELRSQSYNASAYDTETDTKRLLKLAEQGGFRNYFAYQAELNVRTEIIELGTPTLAYVRMWQYDNVQSNELFVPALVFPVTKNSTYQPFYQKQIVIPLIKEILDAEPPSAIPMPLGIEPGH